MRSTLFSVYALITYYDVLPDIYGHLLGLIINAQYQYTQC